MALQNTSNREILPKGAIILTRDEAVDYQFLQIRNWDNIWEVWPFRIGVPGLALLSGITALRINKRFRVKLSLRNYGLGSTTLAIGATPAMLASVPHLVFITQDIFLNLTQCPLCLENRAALIQVGASIVWPLVMAPTANFMFAVRHSTYRLPDWRDYKGTFQLWVSILKPIRMQLACFALINAAAASFMTYSEMKCLNNVKMILQLRANEASSEFDEKIVQVPKDEK